MISRGSRSCFEVDRSGVGGVVQLLQSSPSGLCVAARFSAPTSAYRWLSGVSGDGVLNVLTSTADSFVPDASRPLLSLAVSLTLHHSGSPPGDVADRAPLADAPASVIDGQSQETKTSCGGDSLVGCTADGSASSPLSAAAARGGIVGRSRPCWSSRPARFETSTVSRASRRPRPLSGGAESVRRCLDGSPASAGVRHVEGDGGSQVRLSSPPRVKRARLCEEGGPSAARNPISVTPDGFGPTFAFGTVHRMMDESLAAWEKADIDEALRRDADLRVQPRAAVKSAGGANLCDTVEVAAREPGGGCYVGAQDLSTSAEAVARHGVASNGDGDRRGGGRRPVTGSISQMAADQSWTAVYARLFERSQSTFVSGGPGVGKTSFLRGFVPFLRRRVPAANAVVVVAPTGSAAKTAKGVTYHFFFGFVKDYKMQLPDPVQEAARLLALERWKPIARRLSKVEVLLLDEVSMVPADNMDVMYELLRQSRRPSAPPFSIYVFGDFLQLSPPDGKMDFTAKCWLPLFADAFLELTHVFRQDQPAFVAALHDARYGRCTAAVDKLVGECTVSDEQYKALECTVLHLMPRHDDVRAHNSRCLSRLCPGERPRDFTAFDSVKVDPDRVDRGRLPDVSAVSPQYRDAALLECVAPRVVQHCRQARVMLIANHVLGLGLFHGSIGRLVDYDDADGTPVVRFENHDVTPGVRSVKGVRDAGPDWVEVLFPPVDFEARLFSVSGCLAVRRQVPFVLGWAITVHRSQSLTLSEAVLDVGEAFGAGMVLAAMSRVWPTRGACMCGLFVGVVCWLIQRRY